MQNVRPRILLPVEGLDRRSPRGVSKRLFQPSKGGFDKRVTRQFLVGETE